MLPRSVISLFCDDIRIEQTGIETLVGVYPDNVNVPLLPFQFPKLGIYTRIVIDAQDHLEKIEIQISVPGSDTQLLTEMNRDVIADARKMAIDNGTPTVGLISKALSAPFAINEAGQVRIIVKIEGVDYIGGILNVQLAL